MWTGFTAFILCLNWKWAKLQLFRGRLRRAGSCEFDIKITGRAAHGAAPYKGIDALAVASECYVGIQNILTRTLPPDVCALITVGRLEAGTRRNISCR